MTSTSIYSQEFKEIFIENKYTRWYLDIISAAIIRPINGSYVERHHIIPKSMNGHDLNSNLIILTAREHFLCHLLLTKMCIDENHTKKMFYALTCMSNGFGRQPRYISKTYEIFKTRAMFNRSCDCTGTKNHFYGKTHKEESKRYGDKNSSKRPEVRAKMSGPRPNFLPHNHYHGWSDEVKQQISKTLTGRPSNASFTIEERKRRSEFMIEEHKKNPRTPPMKGKNHSDNSNQKNSESNRNRPRFECPHCRMKCQQGTFTRWHGDNCKHKAV